MEASFLTRHPKAKDVLGFIGLGILVLIGTLLINAFLFRSFSVTGPSMEDTLFTGDRLIVSRLAVTVAHAKNESYVPERGQIIVFENPRYVAGQPDRYIVKRVIAFPGERVTVRDGAITVYNNENPDGFNPDTLPSGGTPKSPTSGNKNTTVPDGELFVAGDNRVGNFSLDSRNNLGTIPYANVIGPVKFRIWPLTDIRSF